MSAIKNFEISINDIFNRFYDGIINLKYIDKNTLDDVVHSFGNKLDIYCDFVKTNFTAVTLYDTKNVRHVIYSKNKDASRTYEEKLDRLSGTRDKDYNGELILEMFQEINKQVYCSPLQSIIKDSKYFNICEGTTFEDKASAICEKVISIPELNGICFLTAGYIIGYGCAEAVYGSDKHSEVTFSIDKRGLQTISGDELKRIATRFVLNDINISSSLGCMYYNISRGINGVNACMDNYKRFGKGNIVKNLTNLMSNFTEFIPIGYSWDSYTPFWMRDSDFISKLKNNTILGYDMICIDNYSRDGRELRNVNSKTLMTTRRRIHEVFGLKFKYYKFTILNEIIAGLYYERLLNINPENIYISKSKSTLPINSMQYEALLDEEKEDYISSSEDKPKLVLPQILVNKCWNSMDSEPVNESPIAANLIGLLNNLTIDGVMSADVELEESYSDELFKYVD